MDTTQFVSQPKLTGAATTATTSSAAAATADAATLARIASRCAQFAQQSDVVSQPQGVRCATTLDSGHKMRGFETIGQNDSADFWVSQLSNGAARHVSKLQSGNNWCQQQGLAGCATDTPWALRTHDIYTADSAHGKSVRKSSKETRRRSARWRVRGSLWPWLQAPSYMSLLWEALPKKTASHSTRTRTWHSQERLPPPASSRARRF